MVTHVYAKSYLQTSLNVAAQSQNIVYKRILPKLRGLTAHEPTIVQRYPLTYASKATDSATEKQSGALIDVYPLFCGITMDFVTAYLFGLSRSTNFIEDEAKCDWWTKSFVERKPYSFWFAEMPDLATLLDKLSLLPVPAWVGQSNRALDAWAMAMCDATRLSLSDTASNDAEKRPEDVPVVYKQLSETMATAKPRPTADELRMNVASDMHDHLAAGDETSTITLLYLFFELSQNPDIQSALRAELATLNPPVRLPSADGTETTHPEPKPLPDLPSPKDMDALPLLHAIYMETLRLHAPIPGPQPRVTPPGGCLLGPTPGASGKIVAKEQSSQFFIPENVRVSASAYSLHRVESAFPEPERWLPGRWLPGFAPTVHGNDTLPPLPSASASATKDVTDEQRFREMNRYFWAFGSGGHMCIGNHFATQTIKLVVAAIVGNFRIDAVNGQNDLEQEDAYSAQPKVKKLVLRLEEF